MRCLCQDKSYPVSVLAGIYGILLAYGLIYPNRSDFYFFPIKMKYFVWIIGGIAFYSPLLLAKAVLLTSPI